MIKLRWVLLMVAVVLVAGLSVAQDKEKPKKKGRLPTGWSKLLKLEKAQDEKIRTIDLKMRQEIDKLNEQIRQVRLKAKREQLAVLTPEQRKTLREALVGEDEDKGKPKDKDKAKPKDKGKSKDKE
jgi:Spy/CpxP family protein refolding chaperone